MCILLRNNDSRQSYKCMYTRQTQAYICRHELTSGAKNIGNMRKCTWQELDGEGEVGRYKRVLMGNTLLKHELWGRF